MFAEIFLINVGAARRRHRQIILAIKNNNLLLF